MPRPARTAAGSRTKHLIDLRFNFAMPFGKQYYVALLAGPQRGHPPPLTRESRTLGSRHTICILLAAAILLATAAFSGLAFLFIVKSALGINLTGDDSFLHPLYEVFFD